MIINVLFDITSYYTKIPVVDVLNIIKDNVNHDQFTRKTAMPLDKILDLVNPGFNNLLVTTFKPQFYQQSDSVAVEKPTYSITAEIYMQVHDDTAVSTIC